MVFNLAELHKAHVLHHCRLLGIPMISQQVKYADEGTVPIAICAITPFLNSYAIQESGNEEKALFAAAIRKHQTEAARVIGCIGTVAAVIILRDALLSTAFYVSLSCAALVLSARYQRRDAHENVHMTISTDAHATAALSVTVSLADVGREVASEGEATVEGSMSVSSRGQMETDSTPRTIG